MHAQAHFQKPVLSPVEDVVGVDTTLMVVVAVVVAVLMVVVVVAVVMVLVVVAAAVVLLLMLMILLCSAAAPGAITVGSDGNPASDIAAASDAGGKQYAIAVSFKPGAPSLPLHPLPNDCVYWWLL